MKSLSLSLCALLAACGGGSEAPKAPPIRSIQLYGDSTQWYAGPDWQAQWPGMVVPLERPRTPPTRSSSSTAPIGKARVRYRDPKTGQTWSGRGLKPKWLSTALADGKKLSDFDIAGALTC